MPDKSGAGARGAGGRFAPGASGNPAGRPAGKPRLRAVMTAEAISMIAGCKDVLLSQVLAIATDAENPDRLRAATWLLERILIAEKPSAPTVEIELDASAGLAAQARDVLSATAAGNLAPADAQKMLAGLASLGTLIEHTELRARLDALQVALEKQGGFKL
jgi:hypothetical protein